MAGKTEVVDRCVQLRDALADNSRDPAYPPARRDQFRLHGIMIGWAAEEFFFRPKHGDDSHHYVDPLAAVVNAIDREQQARPGDEASIDACLEANVAARLEVASVTA